MVTTIKKQSGGIGTNYENDKIIIVPDSCSIPFATAEIPESFFINDPKAKGYISPDKRPKTFFDIYLGLSHSKVKSIDVIDIVLAEVSGCTLDGTIFDQSITDHPGGKNLLDFTKKKQKNSDFLRLVPTKLGSDLISFYTSCIHLMKQAEHLVALYAGTKSEAAVKNLNAAIRSAKRKISADKGETVMAEYIGTLHHPVLFVTDDGAGYAKIRDHLKTIDAAPPVRGVNTLGMLEMLKESGIFKDNGIRENVDVMDMFAVMSKHGGRFDTSLANQFPVNQMIRYSSKGKNRVDENATTITR